MDPSREKNKKVEPVIFTSMINAILSMNRIATDYDLIMKHIFGDV